MAFPGERAIKQFPGGTADAFVAVILEEREFAVLMDPDNPENWEVRVGDGVTPGGILRLVSKEYVDIVAGNSGVQLGDDSTALAGTDTEQRSWPATAFAQFAKQNNALLSGAPTLDSTPSNSDSSLRLANTGWVVNNFKKLGYLGSTQDQVDFPVGHILVANANSNASNRNATPGASLRISNDNNVEYKVGGSGAVLSGTWRSRGRIFITGGDNYYMFERVL